MLSICASAGLCPLQIRLFAIFPYLTQQSNLSSTTHSPACQKFLLCTVVPSAKKCTPNSAKRKPKSWKHWGEKKPQQNQTGSKTKIAKTFNYFNPLIIKILTTRTMFFLQKELEYILLVQWWACIFTSEYCGEIYFYVSISIYRYITNVLKYLTS